MAKSKKNQWVILRDDGTWGVRGETSVSDKLKTRDKAV